MCRRFWLLLRLLMIAVVCGDLCVPVQSQNTPAPKSCANIVSEYNFDNTLLGKDKVFDAVTNFSCFAEASSLQPAHASLVAALASFGNGQQQGSSLSSGSSTSAVTKPSGPLAAAEEFGGLNATAGTSSTTFQFSPGTLLLNQALSGVRPICDSILKTGCISSKAYKFWSGLTLKGTANTAAGTQSLTGSPTTTTTSSAVPVTIKSNGSSTPTFGGFTAQYTYKLGNQPKATAQDTSASLASQQAGQSQANPDIPEIVAAAALESDLPNCPAYAVWQSYSKNQFLAELARPKHSDASLATVVTQQYKSLWGLLLNDSTCTNIPSEIGTFFQKELQAEAYDDFGSSSQNSTVPAVAVEYDLNTPQNQPTYSSIKATVILQWGLKKKPLPAPARTPDSSTTVNPCETAEDAKSKTLDEWICSTAQLITAASKSGISVNGAQSSSEAGKLTPPWSLNAMLSAEIYNSAPPSTVPSGTNLRDIQAGAELDRLFALSQSTNPVAKLFGNLTLGFAFLYQDQTGPSILKGIPSNITFTGLPSNTTSVYAVRGPIQLGQIRLGFGTGSKVSFPIAATYSNRTELVTKPTFGLHFGISYNFTSLFTSPATQSTSNNNAQ